jgi:hypothetical protein
MSDTSTLYVYIHYIQEPHLAPFPGYVPISNHPCETVVVLPWPYPDPLYDLLDATCNFANVILGIMKYIVLGYVIMWNVNTSSM